MIPRRQAQPPVGYADWQEAARDARDDGILVALDVRDRDLLIVIPEDVWAEERRRRDASGGSRLRLVPPGERA